MFLSNLRLSCPLKVIYFVVFLKIVMMVVNYKCKPLIRFHSTAVLVVVIMEVITTWGNCWDPRVFHVLYIQFFVFKVEEMPQFKVKQLEVGCYDRSLALPFFLLLIVIT